MPVRPALNLDLSSDVLQYAGTVSSNGEVNKQQKEDISPAELQLEAKYAYTGKAIEPKPTVKLGELLLTEGVDYELSYENNIEIGENSATVIVSGIGSYKGKVSANFTIVENPYIVSDPRIEKDYTMAAGQKVSWDTLWLGSYPQSEVTAEDIPALEQVPWDETTGDTTIEGVKYRRITRSDNWPEDAEEYRYFKYEPIKWRVLSVDYEKGTAFCLADEGLDCQRYHNEEADVTWETSSIRTWLNDSSTKNSKSFINSAFTEAERAAIIKTSVENKNNLNPEWNTNGGNSTEDYIFSLSESEVYGGSATSFGFIANRDTSDEARRCTATTFAQAMGAWINSDEDFGFDCCDWWLRSPGEGAGFAGFGGSEGDIRTDGHNVSNNEVAVRPALNLNLQSSELRYAGTVASTGEVNEVDYPRDLSSATLYMRTKFTYNGKTHTPKPVVILGKNVLTEGEDYKLSYKNNVKKGTATVIVSGIGAYMNEARKDFTIELSHDICFYDVKISKWYHDSIHRVKDLGLMSGYQGDREGDFGPNDTITRGQVAVILWNMAGKPKSSQTTEFKDVKGKSTKYYYKAVLWAEKTKVVSGFSDHTFRPNDKVTREQLGIMLANYAQKIAKKNPSGSAADYKHMKDANDVTKNVNIEDKIGWCFKQGILSGTSSGELLPKGDATRAHAAKMVLGLYDFIQ